MQHNGNTSNTSNTQPNDIAMRWPAFEAALQYRFTKSLTGKLFYVYESFTKKNGQTDTLTPFQGPGFPELLMPQWGISVPRRSRPPVLASP